MDYPYDFRQPASPATGGSPTGQPPNLSLNLSTLSVNSQPVSPISKDELMDDDLDALDRDRDGTPPDSAGGGVCGPNGNGLAMGVLGAGKPLPTNNFVTKLYQMISDPKSTPFISWTSLGTSFVVSSVGEFSRTILGAHFKHNNFSSFVRQLNMYGFHKINRTPRAQRTSTDSQTWEFSHHKFLRGRPDLLEEIKRKALEPDGGVKARIELPGEVANQLTQMREENRRMWDVIQAERRKVDRLTHLLARLSDAVGVPLDESPPPSSASPNPAIYVQPPPQWEQQQRKRPRIETNPSAWTHQSPTQHIPSPHHMLPQIAHSHSTLSSPLDGVPNPSKKYARARSDSAPLHHQQQQYSSYTTTNNNNSYWDIGRPRSGGGGGMMMQSGMVNISGQGA